MIFLALWLFGAIVTFFWSYPGGMAELKRDCISYRANVWIYAGGMTLVWFLMFIWMLNAKHRTRIRNSHVPKLREVR